MNEDIIKNTKSFESIAESIMRLEQRIAELEKPKFACPKCKKVCTFKGITNSMICEHCAE